MLTFRAEDPEFLNEYYGRQELLDSTIIPLEDYHKKLEAVTKDQINELVRKYIVTNTLNLALVWNKPSDDKLKDLLSL